MVTKEKIREALKEVIDPEVGSDIISMGLIKNIKINESQVNISMTLTVPKSMCPLADYLVKTVKQKIEEIEGVKKVKVDLV